MKDQFQIQTFFKAGLIEAGCDEAGRGCLAGPVFAAAVILPETFNHPLLNDSKKLTEAQRNLLREVIEEEAICWAVASMTNVEIDQLNILKASIMTMHKALNELIVRPEHIIIDGNRFYPYKNIPFQCIVKGDSKYASIAAASVLAKTHRDQYMLDQHQNFPEYGWNKSKGYPTLAHREAIKKYGICSLHRKSYKLLSDQLEIDFEQ